jgi:rRNA maturation RNase YbeY
MSITFQNADVKFKVPDGSRLKDFISKKVKQEVKKNLQLNYVFCSDEFLFDINLKFLNHDFYTDIITFPLSETEKEIEGEIYISIDRVKDNALKLKTDFKEELHRVIFHGVLHLMGYKDKTKTQVKAMRKKENEWLAEYFS